MKMKAIQQSPAKKFEKKKKKYIYIYIHTHLYIGNKEKNQPLMK